MFNIVSIKYKQLPKYIISITVILLLLLHTHFSYYNCHLILTKSIHFIKTLNRFLNFEYYFTVGAQFKVRFINQSLIVLIM